MIIPAVSVPTVNHVLVTASRQDYFSGLLVSSHSPLALRSANRQEGTQEIILLFSAGMRLHHGSGICKVV
jgi:hypothetical protein